MDEKDPHCYYVFSRQVHNHYVLVLIQSVEYLTLRWYTMNERGSIIVESTMDWSKRASFSGAISDIREGPSTFNSSDSSKGL